MKEIIRYIKPALLLLLLFSILTGLIYPLAITAIAQLFFPQQANGSLLKINNQLIGSRLIGQSFTDDKYFWSRPSATLPFPYNAASSSGSNLGPLNPTFIATLKDRAAQIKKISMNNNLIPVDLVTASASGLDPEISPAAAFYQAARIAKARKLSQVEIIYFINQHIVNRTFGMLGEPRVNVLELNLALDKEIYAERKA